MPNDKIATIMVPAKVRPDKSATDSLLPDGDLPAQRKFHATLLEDTEIKGITVLIKGQDHAAII